MTFVGADAWPVSDPRGHRQAPALLAALADHLRPDQLRWWVIHCWISAAEEDLSRAEWITLFRLAGFTHDGEAAELPGEPLRLYRGASEPRASGLAWTTSASTARKFATSDGARSAAGRLWTCAAPPSALLARWTLRHEHEVVIDPSLVVVKPCSDAVDRAMEDRPASPARAVGKALAPSIEVDPLRDRARPGAGWARALGAYSADPFGEVGHRPGRGLARRLG